MNECKHIACLLFVISLDAFFAYFSVWFGVSRDARPVEAFFNSNTCIIWNALTELSALTLISVFNFLYIYLSSLSTYIPHASFCM